MAIEVGESNLFIPQKPLLSSSVRVLSNHDKSVPYVGFAGLGYPDKFRQTLLAHSFDLQDFIPFADHHPYTADDIQKIRNAASNARIITTAKDYVRIPPELRNGIDVLEIAIAFNDPDKVYAILSECMAAR